MMKKIHVWATCLLLLGLYATVQAQETKTEHQPVYRPIDNSCILSKICYEKDKTILHFRYLATPFISVMLYGTEGAHPWLLHDKAADKIYPLKGIYNVKKEGQLLYPSISEKLTTIPSNTAQELTVFEFEIHFDRLDENAQEVDLIEGWGMEKALHHFHCFDIQVDPLKEKKAEATAIVCLKSTEKDSLAALQPTIKDNKPNVIAQQEARLSEALISNWRLFPTPTQHTLYIQQDAATAAQLSIANMLGQTVWSGSINASHKTIDVSKLHPGSYWLYLDKNGAVSCQKFIKL